MNWARIRHEPPQNFREPGANWQEFDKNLRTAAKIMNAREARKILAKIAPIVDQILVNLVNFCEQDVNLV